MGIEVVRFQSTWYQSYRQFLEDVFAEASTLYHQGHDILQLTIDSYKGSLMQGPVESSVATVMYDTRKVSHAGKDLYAEIFEAGIFTRYDTLVTRVSNKANEVASRGAKVISLSFDSYRSWWHNASFNKKKQQEYEDSIAILLWDA